MCLELTLEPGYENKPREEGGGGRGLAVLAIIISLLSIGASLYFYYSISSQLNDLNSQTTLIQGVNSQLSTFNADLANLNAKVASLNASIAKISGGVVPPPATGLTAKQIYNITANSVVLITVQLTGGTGEGSGFVYDPSGLIVTNDHVVSGANPGSITVTFINGTTVGATVVGTDVYSDIAVIKVSASAALLKPLKLGSSSSLVVGDQVYAIGNPYGLADTITQGIISAKGRELDEGQGYLIVDVLQTDAAINPGNSGGPLLNLKGEVVGINTAVPSQTSTGIGFAVPSDTIAREVPSLISKGGYDHPFLGITGVDVDQGVIDAMGLPRGSHGTLVVTVVSGGPADKAGLRGGTRTATVDGAPLSVGGDVITSADGHPLKFFYDLMVYIERNKKPGDQLILGIIRNGSSMTVTVTLGVRPQPGG